MAGEASKTLQVLVDQVVDATKLVSATEASVAKMLSGFTDSASVEIQKLVKENVLPKPPQDPGKTIQGAITDALIASIEKTVKGG